MARRIKITAGSVSQTAVLNDSQTAEALWNILPIESTGNTWGEEIYFTIPLEIGEENGQATVELGDIGYWPPGPAFCIFFGPTPMSSGDEIRPASPVNVFGHLEGDPKAFVVVPSGSRVTVEKVEEG
ncbi:MAG: hypothetical protein GX100_12435 [candidate division WS1 bacterium]|jgi:hypothetical protein|nr:hypothetical protein [candidate division WS1 bacterium]